MSEINQIVGEYDKVRRQTVKIANLFEEKDWLKQSMADASPIRWHLGHTSWFFDHFVLKNHVKNYQSPGKKYDFFFNSYYNLAGKMLARNLRGSDITLTLGEMMNYRTMIEDFRFSCIPQKNKKSPFKKSHYSWAEPRTTTSRTDVNGYKKFIIWQKKENFQEEKQKVIKPTCQKQVDEF